MPEAVLVSALRAPIGTAVKGTLRDTSAFDRARIFRLGWDFAGSALASRNEQYERFYLGSGARNRQNVQLRADRILATLPVVLTAGRRRWRPRPGWGRSWARGSPR